MNFRRLATGLDVAPLLTEVRVHPALWRECTVRQNYPGTVHADTETIVLRGPAEWTYAVALNSLSAVDVPNTLRHAGPLLEQFQSRLVNSNIGRIMIVKLKPGGRITAHIDEGLYAEHFARFHIVLQSDVGNEFTCGGETVRMVDGEAWWFNHRRLHSVRNDSSTERIHLIVDARADGLNPESP